jgi:hypothetical protein
MQQPFQVGLPGAKFEVKIVLAIALHGCGGASLVRFLLRESRVCLERKNQGEQPDNNSRGIRVHDTAPGGIHRQRPVKLSSRSG